MARFRSLARGVVSVPADKVKEQEKRERRAAKKKPKP